MSTIRTNGVGWAGSMANSYQQNQTQKNPNSDTIGKLVIQNYAKDLGLMIFWGWDILAADEFIETYMFQLKHRSDKTLRVYVTLARELQPVNWKNKNKMMYQCYITDDAGDWQHRTWFDSKDLTYTNFWAEIEEVVDKYHPINPF